MTASRCAGAASAGSITSAPSRSARPRIIVFVPGPDINEGLGARRMVYTCCDIVCSLCFLPVRSTSPNSRQMLWHGPQILRILRQMHVELSIALNQDGRVSSDWRGCAGLQQLGHAAKGREI